MKHLIISFLAKDRPGLVDSISQIINAHSGNWQSSSMSHLSGYFAGILQASVPSEQVDELITSLRKVEDIQLHIATAESANKKEENTLHLEVTANDRAGIIQEISSVVHRCGGNLLKLVSNQGNAPHFGGQIFKAKLIIAIEDEQKTDNLVDALEGIANDLIVDINH